MYIMAYILLIRSIGHTGHSRPISVRTGLQYKLGRVWLVYISGLMSFADAMKGDGRGRSVPISYVG